MNKKLYRDEYHKVIGGVCAGLAEYFDMDVTIIRLLFAFTFFVMGVGLIPYIILWIVLPRKGYVYNNFNNPTVDYRVPPQPPVDGPQATTQQPSSSQYGNNPFGGNPFGYDAYKAPVQNVQGPKPPSHAGIIVGVVLIVIGGLILIDNYDLIPDFDFGNLWPVPIIVAGIALLISGQARSRSNHQNIATPDNSTNNNPPAAETAETTAE